MSSIFREQSRDRDRDKEKKRDREEDEEEAYERRKLERKLREKEAAYQEVSDLSLSGFSLSDHIIGWFDRLFIFFNYSRRQRLKNWELRERKKARDYSKEMEREEERRREMVKQLFLNVFK